MCLRVKDNAYIKIAKEDIPCYKFVKHGFLNLFWHSPLYEKTVKRKYNKILKAVDHLKYDCESSSFSRTSISEFIISQGFHAFLTERAAKNNYYLGSPSYFCDLRMAIIPKGSEYCFGENGDIVSNQIIVTRKTIKKNELYRASYRKVD